MSRLAESDRHQPGYAAVVVIDVQNDFCAEDGSLPRLYGFDLQHVEQMVPRLERLIGAARTAGLPVIFVRTTHDESTDSPAWLGRLGQGTGSERAGVTCRTGSWGAEFYRLQPQPGDHIVTKHRFSAFVGTNLAITLASLGVRSVLFTGVATEVCVESSLRDGLFNDLYVTLVQDCAASYSRAAHDASVGVVGKHFGLVADSDQLIDLWARRGTTKEVHHLVQ